MIHVYRLMAGLFAILILGGLAALLSLWPAWFFLFFVLAFAYVLGYTILYP